MDADSEAQQAAIRWLSDAMAEAARGADPRRVYSHGSFSREPGKPRSEMRERFARSHAAGFAHAIRLTSHAGPGADPTGSIIGLITDRTVNGVPCFCCETFDMRTGESAAVAQPYRKRLLRWTRVGSVELLGAAEPLDSPAEAEAAIPSHREPIEANDNDRHRRCQIAELEARSDLTTNERADLERLRIIEKRRSHAV